MIQINHSMAAERALKRILGEEHAEQIIAATDLFPAPIPVAGTGLYVVDGIAVPAIMGGGFTSLSDLISEATTGGKGQDVPFAHVGSLAVTGVAEFLFYTAGIPGVGASPAAVAAGTIPGRTTVGAYGQANAAGGDTLHVTTLTAIATTAAPATLLLIDLLWYGALAMSSSGAQTISGVPTRYTTTAAKGNFACLPIRTGLSATAHNNTVTYVDQDGNTAEAAAAAVGVSAGAATRFDHPNWFIPLNAGDTGVRNLTAYQNSSAVVTGQLDAAVAHPLAMVPLGVAGLAGVMDGINSAFNLQQVFDNACLTSIGIRGTATAITYAGDLELVSG